MCEYITMYVRWKEGIRYSTYVIRLVYTYACMHAHVCVCVEEYVFIYEWHTWYLRTHIHMLYITYVQQYVHVIYDSVHMMDMPPNTYEYGKKREYKLAVASLCLYISHKHNRQSYTYIYTYTHTYSNTCVMRCGESTAINNSVNYGY